MSLSAVFFTIALAAILVAMLTTALVRPDVARRAPWLRRAPLTITLVGVGAFIAAVVAIIAGR